MTTLQRIASVSTIALLALPAFASAQVYYYAPNTTSGAFNYGSSFNSSIPSSAMPYVQLGYQMQQQSQSQSQSQYQYYQPSSYNYPSYNSSYPYLYQNQPTYPSYQNYMMPSYYSYQQPYSYSYQQPYSYDEYDSSYGPYQSSYYDEYDMPTCYDSYSCGSYSEDPYVVY